MKSNLHIFGCSHSSPNSAVGIDNHWIGLLKNKLNLGGKNVVGAPGKNVDYIKSDAYQRCETGLVTKNDYVILNTSYPWRSGSHVEVMSNQYAGCVDYMEDDKTPYNLNIFDFNFITWYIETKNIYNYIKQYCDNVYQWCLDVPTELDTMYEHLFEKRFESFEKFNYQSYWYSIHPPHNYEDLEKNRKIVLNKWENLIEVPSDYKTWHEFIEHKKNNGAPIDLGHIGHEGSKLKSDIFYKHIIKDKKTK
jgi:hypothetical protein